MKALRAQVAAEVAMTLRRGETLLLTLGIPLLLLVFFSEVKITTSQGNHPVDLVTPGILALAVMSTSMVSLGIATGFERGYGVLKRLGATPLGRGRLLTAKVLSVILIEILQGIVIVTVGLALGWNPSGGLIGAVQALLACLLGSVAFGGIGLAMAGRLRAEVNLAAANGLYLVLLLLGGMVVPLVGSLAVAIVGAIGGMVGVAAKGPLQQKHPEKARQHPGHCVVESAVEFEGCVGQQMKQPHSQHDAAGEREEHLHAAVPQRQEGDARASGKGGPHDQQQIERQPHG